jgi:4-alpha-glucanotransferase
MRGGDRALAELARVAGIAVDWVDASDTPRRVAPDVLRHILNALGVACATDREVVESAAQLRYPQPLSMITCDRGEAFSVCLPAARHARIIFEDGSQQDVKPHAGSGDQLLFPPIDRTGYHQLEIGGIHIPLAVAPRRCVSLSDVGRGDRLWGIAVQLYGLRRNGDMGIGDTTALATLAQHAARHGADALALSPTHALFGGDLEKYSPYSPSNRVFLNPLFADPATIFGADRIAALQHEMGFDIAQPSPDALINWPEAAARKLLFFRRLFESFYPQCEADLDDDRVRSFRTFRAAGGDLLESHARFEAIYAARKEIDSTQTDWRNWPAELRDPKHRAVADFAAAHAREIAFHIFLQWIADRSIASAQMVARQSEMRIGLIADLAVGMESGGSQAWSRQDESLVGLTIGAPPDFFNPKGQSWGLTTFSPLALQTAAFAPFLAIIRTALRHAGGVRIDHAMGLARLWLIPDGTAPSEGAYLSYPLTDLLRLIKLESERHRAIVIGEDLGTVPEGFREILDDAGIAGTDVLWFARRKNKFLPPAEWRKNAIAMTSTHDLPTLSGWWQGRDIKLREACKLFGANEDRESLLRTRSEERSRLWQAFQSSGAVAADAPPPEDASPAVDTAIAFVSATPSPLLLLPLEDLLAREEQPNLPGTIDEHPNWRRRYPENVETILNTPSVARRIGALSRGRTR